MINRKRKRLVSKFIGGAGEEKYGNELKVNVCLSLEMFLCFPAALLISLFLSLLLQEARESRNLGHQTVRARPQDILHIYLQH